MLMLRLARAGSKKRPVYHLVAADRRARRDGRFIENLGYHVPARDILVLKMDRIEYWLSQGAQLTVTARSLIKAAKKAPPAEEAPAPEVAAAPAAEQPAAPVATEQAAAPVEAPAAAEEPPAPAAEA